MASYYSAQRFQGRYEIGDDDNEVRGRERYDHVAKQLDSTGREIGRYQASQDEIEYFDETLKGLKVKISDDLITTLTGKVKAIKSKTRSHGENIIIPSQEILLKERFPICLEGTFMYPNGETFTTFNAVTISDTRPLSKYILLEDTNRTLENVFQEENEGERTFERQRLLEYAESLKEGERERTEPIAILPPPSSSSSRRHRSSQRRDELLSCPHPTTTSSSSRAPMSSKRRRADDELACPHPATTSSSRRRRDELLLSCPAPKHVEFAPSEEDYLSCPKPTEPTESFSGYYDDLFK